jgi:hypothetical protein
MNVFEPENRRFYSSMKSLPPNPTIHIRHCDIDSLRTVQYVFCVRRASHVDCSLILD